MTNEVENKMNENVENNNINETNQIVESQNNKEMNETKIENEVKNENKKTAENATKKPRRKKSHAEQMLDVVRRELHVVTEAELNEKDYVCTFSEKTHKMTSIKKKSENPITSETTEKTDAHYKKAFFFLIQDLTDAGFKMSFTDSDRLRMIRQSVDMQIIRAAKKNAEPTEHTEQVAETDNQTEQVAA